MSAAGAYIEMSHISKSFASVRANEDVGISVNRGEILALLGENGSGKSTLVNILSGLYLPDSGTIYIDGKRRFFRSPHDAIIAGIGMVHQHFMLIPVMSAWENISLGEKPGDRRADTGGPHAGAFFGNPFLNRKKIKERIKDLETRFGLHVEPDKMVRDMSVGEKQTVEIIKMLYRGASTLILDEPTAVLTPQETAGLFAMLRNMREAGCAIIIITHKLREVMEISDRVTVLRRGRAAGTVRTADTDPRQLTEMMVGGSVSLEIRREEPVPREKPILEVRDLKLLGPGGVPLIDHLSFELAAGEILGVAGIAGSGQKELCEIITGLCRADSGSVRFLGEEILGLTPLAIKRRGVSMSFIPEDRLGMGLAGGMSVSDNILLKSYDMGGGPFVDRIGGRSRAEGIVERYNISTPSVRHAVKKLSGGNIQKVLLGREIETRPKLLITAYPVRGLDIGASYSIYEMLNAQKKRGAGILYIGEDLDVLRELCDRVMVIHSGAVMDTVDPRLTSKEDIGLLMLGYKPETP
jgi:simple sugar transport system ATP-binding protein